MPPDRLTVGLDDEMRRRVVAEAHATGKSESELMREALVAYFRRRPEPESCLDIARRAGIIGCARNLARDLSTSCGR